MASRLIITFHMRRPIIRYMRLCPKLTIPKLFVPYYQVLRTMPLKASVIKTPLKYSLYGTVTGFSHQRSTTATKKQQSERKLSLAPPLKTETAEMEQSNEPIFHIVYADDTHYYGQVHGTKRNGLGAQYDKNDKLIYLGEWKDDKYQGIGVLEKDQIVYKGEFKEGLPCGQGIELHNNQKFVGFFKEGKKEGAGTLYQDGSTTKQGIWRDNRFSSVH